MATDKQKQYVSMLEDSAGIRDTKDISNLSHSEISDYINYLQELIKCANEMQYNKNYGDI